MPTQQRPVKPDNSPGSDFLRRQFETAGISDIADRVSSGERLDAEDVESLADLQLPLLAKLVDLLPDHEPSNRPAIDPVVYLPMTQRMKSDSREAAMAWATDTIGEAASELRNLIEQDERVREFGGVRTLHVVVDALDTAAYLDLTTPIDGMSHTAEGIWISACPQSRCVSWSDKADESEAANSMRAIAFARLTSSETEVHAPVGQLGTKASHVALSFGANHLGQVAVNDETATALQIPTLAEVAEAFRYDTPTEL